MRAWRQGRDAKAGGVGGLGTACYPSPLKERGQSARRSVTIATPPTNTGGRCRRVNANPSSADFYERLGVAPDVTPEQITAAFKAMRKELYPDSRPESLRQHFDKLMQNVNEAYQTLSDPPARAKYDAKRRAGAKASSRRPSRGPSSNSAKSRSTASA